MDRQGDMFNLFIDGDGRQQTVAIGNINDMVTLDNIKEVRRLGFSPNTRKPETRWSRWTASRR